MSLSQGSNNLSILPIYSNTIYTIIDKQTGSLTVTVYIEKVTSIQSKFLL